MKRIGDRKDAKKVRNLDGLHNVMIDIKPERCDSDVYMNKEIDVTKLIKYVEKYKKEHPDDKITYFHAFAMAFAKTIYNKPLLNRFVANRTFYDRNDVIIAFVAKIAFEEDSEEVMINIKVDKDDNIFTLRDKITKRVAKIRNSKKGEKKENTNNINVPHLHFGIQIIFDEVQKEGPNQIWCDLYDLVNFLKRNSSEVYRSNDKTKDYSRKIDFIDSSLPD